MSHGGAPAAAASPPPLPPRPSALASDRRQLLHLLLEACAHCLRQRRRRLTRARRADARRARAFRCGPGPRGRARPCPGMAHWHRISCAARTGGAGIARRAGGALCAAAGQSPGCARCGARACAGVCKAPERSFHRRHKQRTWWGRARLSGLHVHVLHVRRRRRLAARCGAGRVARAGPAGALPCAARRYVHAAQLSRQRR